MPSSISLPTSHPPTTTPQTAPRSIYLIVLMTAIYYLGVGITAMPRVMLINQRIAGNARHPNSESAFTVSTSMMLSTLATVLFSKYFSALGDYLGRRPVLAISTFFSIVSNFLWIQSTTPTGFYIASVVGGIADIFFYVGLSWICDLASEKSHRGKSIGIYVGTVAGLTLSLAVPIGALFSSTGKLTTAYKASIILFILVLFLLVFLPIDDTLGIIPKYHPSISSVINEIPSSDAPNTSTPDQRQLAMISTVSYQQLSPSSLPRRNQRHLPPNCQKFLLEHLPISWKTIQLLCKESSRPLDWVGNLFVHTSLKVLRLIIVQYFFVICDFGPLLVGACSILLGLISFLTLPFFLSRYTPESLVAIAVLGTSIGFLLLSTAGTSVDQSTARVLSLLGLFVLAFSASWHPSFQTIITSQYPINIMGSVSGTLAIATEFGYFPAYAISILFSLSLSHRSEADKIWSGCSFLICTFLCWMAVAIHLYTRGGKTLTLSRLNTIHPADPLVIIVDPKLNPIQALVIRDEIQEISPTPLFVPTELRSYCGESNQNLAIEEIP